VGSKTFIFAGLQVGRTPVRALVENYEEFLVPSGCWLPGDRGRISNRARPLAASRCNSTDQKMTAANYSIIEFLPTSRDFDSKGLQGTWAAKIKANMSILSKKKSNSFTKRA
jgi:hypothetical protein